MRSAITSYPLAHQAPLTYCSELLDIWLGLPGKGLGWDVRQPSIGIPAAIPHKEDGDLLFQRGRGRTWLECPGQPGDLGGTVQSGLLVWALSLTATERKKGRCARHDAARVSGMACGQKTSRSNSAARCLSPRRPSFDEHTRTHGEPCGGCWRQREALLRSPRLVWRPCS
jgi:hypothetical protein